MEHETSSCAQQPQLLEILRKIIIPLDVIKILWAEGFSAPAIPLVIEIYVPDEPQI